MRTRLIAVLAVLMLTAACGGEPEEASDGSWTTTGVQAASSPVGEGGTVAVVDGSSSDLEMTVLDAETGEVRFTRPWTPSARYPGMGVGRPALLGEVLVGMEADGFQTVIVARDSTSGDELWKQSVSETFGPFVCGELICSEDDWSLPSAALVARDPETGEVRWTSPGSQTHSYSSPELLVELDLNLPTVRSVDPATGQQRWLTDLSATLGPQALTVVSPGQLAGGTLVIESSGGPGTINGTVGLDPATGAVKWSHPGFGLCPQPAPEVIAVCGAGSGTQRLDPATGQPQWTAEQFVYPRGPGPLLGVTGDLSHMLGRNAEDQPIAIDLESGEVSEPEPGLGWMRFVSRETGKKGPDAPAGEYFGSLEPVPWNAATGNPAPVRSAADVPEFVGLELAGTRIFVDASGNLQGLPA
ncbi:MAG TPA: PQQ-binding-like beta-propeller repeat protein [Actinomycetota bacterium]|nr:PQQ-binding-like beta-propeller repeat protein [Actinomycetota bacterium]